MDQHWLTDSEMSSLPANESTNPDDACNPVKMYGRYWYFWNIPWTCCYGPFYSETDAKVACEKYEKYYL